jgi:predicted lipoprotein with Yx(FWY)xxD motif
MPASPIRPPAAPERRSWRTRRGMLAAAPVAVCLLAATALVSVALAKTFTLTVAKHATVTNFNTHKSVKEAVVVNAKGFVVYTLSGDSKAHPKCTKANGCFGFWPPVTVASIKKLSKAPGIKGKLGTWKRNGLTQVTLGGHPLYTFSVDTKKRSAQGEALKSFGGTWHVVKAGSAGKSPSKGGQTPSTPMPTPTTPSYPSGW